MLSTWIEWSVWIKFNFFKKPRMWEYINQCVSYNTLYHSGAKKEKTALQKSCLNYYFLSLVALLLLDDLKALL